MCRYQWSASSSVSVMWALPIICPRSAKRKADRCDGRSVPGIYALQICPMTACITAPHISGANSHSPNNVIITHNGIWYEMPHFFLRRIVCISFCCGSGTISGVCRVDSTSTLSCALWCHLLSSACWICRLRNFLLPTVSMFLLSCSVHCDFRLTDPFL